jgi:hypothetical protein
VGALGPLAGSDEHVRQLLLDRLADEDYTVRAAAVGMLSSFIQDDAKLRRQLIPWLGSVSEIYSGREISRNTRQKLAEAYGSILTVDPELFAQVVAMLSSPAAPVWVA